MKNKILLILKQCDDYTSGEKISELLGITRSAVWKYIKILRNEGYIIDSSTNKGYKLIETKNKINEFELQHNLQTKNLGRKLIYLQSVDSTNSEVKKLAQKGYSEGTTVVAEQQTTGKGRLGRIWDSPPNTGLWFSFLIKPDISPLQVAGITLATGLGVCKAIRSYTKLDSKIKWPNDIIIGNKKVCGILTEMTAEADKIEYAVVGIGINVNTDKFPQEIQYKATSLMIESGYEIERTELFKTVLYEIEKYLYSYFENYGIYVIDEYKKYCATLGRKVIITRGNKTIEGTAVDIANTGELIIKNNEQEILYINSGEVTVQGIY